MYIIKLPHQAFQPPLPGCPSQAFQPPLPGCPSSPTISHIVQYSTTSFNLKPTNPSVMSSSIKSQITICSSIAKTRGTDLTGPTQHCPSGEIHVIVGPMFAGKTTALLRRVKSEAAIGRKVALIKSSKDDRYAVDSVVTHDGIKYPCWALPNLQAFTHRLGSDAYHKLDVIGIDEAQFFDDLYEFCCNAADNDGKTIVIAGLDGDYLRRSFGSVLDLIPIADTVTKLTARCELCGRKAFFTLRKTAETQTELIAGADVYMPVCRQHYVNGQVIVEAAKVQSDHTFEPAAVKITKGVV